MLKIQNVGDERGYLDAIRREESVEAIQAAEIAEAQNELRVRRAELGREGETAEKIARVRAQEAEVEAEKVLEMKRVEREEQRLRADVIEPAKSEKMAAFAGAEAEAAPILERGKAQVEVLRRLYAEVQTGGDAAFAVFMAEKLPELLEIAVGAVEGVDIDRLVVMDGGQGEGVSNALNQRVWGAYGTMEGLASVLGLDIQEVLQRAVGSSDADGGEGSAPELPPAWSAWDTGRVTAGATGNGPATDSAPTRSHRARYRIRPRRWLPRRDRGAASSRSLRPKCRPAPVATPTGTRPP